MKDDKKKKEKNEPKITVILLNKPSEEAIKNFNKVYRNILRNLQQENKSLD
jgi:hypothetical protein